MISCSHWGMFLAPMEEWLGWDDMRIAPGDITLTVRDSRGVRPFKEWAALPPEIPVPFYQRLNFGPDLP